MNSYNKNERKEMKRKSIPGEAFTGRGSSPSGGRYVADESPKDSGTTLSCPGDGERKKGGGGSIVDD